jgi:hypothetical protein
MKLGYYSSMAADYENELKTHSMFAEEGAYLKKTYQELIAIAKSAAAPQQPQQPSDQQQTSYESTVVAGTPGVITLKELQNLVKRIDEEHLRLANLRSTSATLVARQSQLEKLAADIRELIGAVERKEMKLEDNGFICSTADKVFVKMSKPTSSLKYF